MFSNTSGGDLLKLMFNGVVPAWLGTSISGAPASYYMTMHSADPGAAGTQTTNEITYTGSARLALARTTAAWTVTGNAVSPKVAVEWPRKNDSAAQSVAYLSLGTAATGAGSVLVRLKVDPPIPLSQGTVPRLPTDVTITAVTTE